MRILVVDDQAQNRYLLERLFAANGHECVGAGNGYLALEVLRTGKFDAIVSDVLMPEMDGFQLCRETRKDAALRETPFIFYTATYTDAADREFGMALGATAYVVKPAEPEELLSAVAGASQPPGSSSNVVSDDSEFYKGYSPRLVRKLEQKVLELEESQRALLRSNDALRDEVKRRGNAEGALGDSLALFEATIASTADGILACDHQGKIVALNAQFFSVWRIVGVDAPPTFDELKLHFRAKVQKPEVFDAVMVLGQQSAPASAILELWDGGELELRRRPLLVAGDVVGQVWSCTNTTERRLSEVRELELQRRLWDAQKLTDLGLLAAGIAHDFNNILTVVRGSVETAQLMVGPGHAAHEVLEDVVVCSETGATLVAQILEFSRREREPATPQNLGRLVKASMRLLKLMAPRTLELHLQLDDTTSLVLVHPAQLTQVLLNLAGNAVHATQGRGRITVGVGEVTESALARGGNRVGRFVELRVSDSGVGIDDATAKRLFEPFFTTKVPGQGTGIGLATVHQIVGDLGGWIVVESVPGKGTMFRVVLPTVTAQEAHDHDAAAVQVEARSERTPGSRATGKRGTVLVMDPQVEEREKLKACLNEVGYAVIASGDGPSAVEALASDGSQCVAAVISGFTSSDLACEVARVFRALRPQLPLVLTSFADYSSLLMLTKDASRCAVLSRPYRAETVNELFSTLIPERGGE